MVKLARCDGADPSVPKKGTIPPREVVYNAVHKLTKSAKGGAFVRDIRREMRKLSYGTDEVVRNGIAFCTSIAFNLCQKGVMKRELRPDRVPRKFSKGSKKGERGLRRCMSYFYYISKAKKGPQMGKKAGPPKAPTSQGLRKKKRDQAGPTQRQEDSGPSTSGLRRSNGGKPGVAGSMGTFSGSGSRRRRPTMVPLIPWLSRREVGRITGRRRRGLAPGGSGANDNQPPVAPVMASDAEGEAELSENGPAAQSDRSKQGRGNGKEPAGSPAPPLIRSSRQDTAATAASQSRSDDTSQTSRNHNSTQHEGEQVPLDEEEIARALQPLSPLGNMLATLQREHAKSTALEVEIASMSAERRDAKTALECAQGEKEKILEAIKDSTESADTLPQLTGVLQLGLAAYEKTISEFRDSRAEARRLESELASLREQETAKKAALESELKKLGKEIESLECRLQKEKVAAEVSKRELDNCSMNSEMLGTLLHNVQNQWEIQKKTRGCITLKEKELAAAKAQAEATKNALAKSIVTTEAGLAGAVSLSRELLAQLLTFRAGSQESAGDHRVSTGAPTPGQSYGIPSQPEKLANDLFLQHQMETKAAKAVESSGQKLQVKRKALAAEDEKSAKTLERVKQYLDDLPPVPSLGTLSTKERGDILRRTISQEKTQTAAFLELYRLRKLLDEQKKANESELQTTKGRADALRMKVEEVGNDMHQLITDLCGTNDVDRINTQATVLLKAKEDLAAAEADLEAAGRRGEVAVKSAGRKISDMEYRSEKENARVRVLVARLYAGTKSAGTGNPGYLRPVEPTGGRNGTHGGGTSTAGPDAGGYPVWTPTTTTMNLEEDAGNVGTDAGMDTAAAPNGNTQEGAGEVGSGAEMEQEERPTRDGPMVVEPVTPASVGPRSESSNTTSPRGGRDNLEDLELAEFLQRNGAPDYPPNCPYPDDYEDEPPPQDFMDEDGGPGPSGSGLGYGSPSIGIDTEAGCSTTGAPGMAPASRDPQDGPEEMDSE